MSNPQPSQQPATAGARRSIQTAKRNPTMDNVVDALGSLADAVDHVHGDLKADVTELKADVTELKTDVAELKTDVTELKADVAELKTDVGTLKRQVGGLTTDVGKLLHHFGLTSGGTP